MVYTSNLGGGYSVSSEDVLQKITTKNLVGLRFHVSLRLCSHSKCYKKENLGGSPLSF
jgi:hypothetical protein